MFHLYDTRSQHANARAHVCQIFRIEIPGLNRFDDASSLRISVSDVVRKFCRVHGPNGIARIRMGLEAATGVDLHDT